MKTSAVLASLLFGSFAVAAPLDPRRLVHKTEIVTETVVIYTTVYEDEPVAQATTTSGGYFYEQPKKPSSVAAVVSSSAAVVVSSYQAPAYTPPPQSQPSSTYVAPPPPPPPQAPAPTPTPAPASSAAPVYTPAPVETPKPVATPQPATSAAYVAPAPAAPSPPPAAPSPYPVNTPSTGEQYTGVDITVYDNNGGYGACGTPLHDDDMIVALSAGLYGGSTYNVQTGAATNPWCGQKIKVEYGGKSIVATIMDLCPGCLHPNDIDLSVAAWKALTGLEEKTRLQASWSKIA
jgi:outer membrane biosynthesis protein TonB